MNNSLPHGWASIALGYLFDFKYGKGLPQERRNGDGSVNVYGSNGVVGVHNTAVTRGPTIVVGRKGSVGEVHLSPQGCWPIDTTYFIDEFPANIPPAYWALCLKSLRLGQQEKSSAIPGISRDDIYAVEVPIPPINEQRRIVAKLEKLLGKVDACQQRLAKIPVSLKRFRQSVLAAACSGRLTADWREKNSKTQSAASELTAAVSAVAAAFDKDCQLAKRHKLRKPARPTCLDDYEIAWQDGTDFPETWIVVPLGKVCRKVTDGTHDTPKPRPSGVPYITAKHIRERRIDFANSLFLSQAAHDEIFARCNPQHGDVLIVNIGAGTATPAMVRVDFEFSLKNVALLKPIKGLLLGEYLELYQLLMKPRVSMK